MKTRIFKLTVLMLLGTRSVVLATSFVSGQPDSLNTLSAPADTTLRSVSDTLSFYDRYPFIRIVPPNSELAPVTDEEFFNTSARVIFPVNKFVLPKNDSLLRLLSGTIFPRINSDSLRLKKLLFRGAASPEGPLRWNRTLGNNRMNALYRFVRQHISTASADTLSQRDVDVEDYRTLCIMMRQAGDRDYGQVKALCDVYLAKDDLPTLKRKLMQVHQGRLWHRLLRTYYPKLRSARFVMILERPELSMPPQHIEASGLPYVLPSLPSVRPIPVPSLVHRRELLSVKTNVLLDLAYMPGYNRWCPIPNVAIEYYPLHGHFTFGASFDCPWWQDYEGHKYFQVRNYQLESRYYFRSGDIRRNFPGQGAAFRGFYVQAYAHVALYGIMFDADNGWMGEGLGGGIGAGYVLPLSRDGHWRLEFQAQAGYFFTGYDPFQYENPVNPNYRDHLYYYKWTQKPALFKKRQYRFSWLGPTRVGITLSYDLLYRRVAKKGVSFRNWEIIEASGAYRANEGNRANKANEANKANKAYKPYEAHEPHKPHKAHEPHDSERRAAQ